ncbi:MAG: methylmalonyl-CoA mutase family protein, partial [Candidatus Thermoplasmatota archaeon]|nr:methylmalonyl-CoA mutase family protein [Candidatus Thermoplasmatota archaeon]
MDAPPPAGKPPFTRGIHEGMYRDRIWTMRQYAGFSDPESTNKRFKSLLKSGQSGLSVAFDLPTQLGFDSDDEHSIGEVGRVGVPIDSISDMRLLFEGIKLSDVSTSMTINAPAAVLLAMYSVVAEEQGAELSEISGTVQNDVLKEYMARGLHIHPPEGSMRLAVDIIEWCSENTPKWNPISVSGYHIREAGSTASQEVGLTISNALAYIEAAKERGLRLDTFAPRISFFFGCHRDFLEEICKFRAARTLWYQIMNERYDFDDFRCGRMRFHTQTAGVTLTAQQSTNNIVRVAYQALASVLGGTQSLHTNGYDEALGLPTEESARVALRTQQIIAHEIGVVDHVDPLGGAPLIEEMTSNIISEARNVIESIDAHGGSVEAVKAGIQTRMIHESAWIQQNELEDDLQRVIGVNLHVEEEGSYPAGQVIDDEAIERQISKLSNHRSTRNNTEV